MSLLYASAPRRVDACELEVPEACSVQQALEQAGWLQLFPEIGSLSLAVWGRLCAPGDSLREGDRVEVLRPLRVDPKVARRERFKGQGARSAGLFAKRRPNSKSGY